MPPLRGIVAAGHDVTLVVSRPDKRRGRGAALLPSPVKAAALELGLPVTDQVDDVLDAGAELGVVVAFGRLIKPHVLARLPMVNVHFSLLPRWRGAAPLERAILAGDEETGVSIMRLDAGLDTGPVFRTVRTPIGADETAGSLTDRLVTLGIPALLDVLDHLDAAAPVAQEGEPTYAEKLTVDEFHLDPARSADELARVVRAGNPRPGAWLHVDGKRVKVLTAHATGDDAPRGSLTWPGAALGTPAGALVLDTVQVEGRRPMTGDAWLAGFRQRTLVLPVS